MTQSDKKAAPKATELARVFPDHPLREETLQFEFEGFARTLAELAWNPDNGTPFTVVVRGGWGRGKITLLRRAQWMLEHPDQLEPQPPEGVREVRTLWFNAWKYPDDDTVLAASQWRQPREVRRIVCSCAPPLPYVTLQLAAILADFQSEAIGDP